MQLTPVCHRVLLALGLALSATVSATNEGLAVPCTSADGVTPLCGFERPEDIEPVADGKWLLVSEYGALAGTLPGRLVIFDPADDSRRIIYPLDPAAAQSAEPGWGDAACPGPPDQAGFAPHGIHHSARSGRDLVLVVNHGGREAIEFFELVDTGAASTIGLKWRGCVVAPDGIWINDVVGLGNGTFAATHMVTRAAGEEALFAAEAQHSNTGWVMAWQPQAGWSKVPGSDGGLPNGIEASADGATLYINEYFGDKVSAIDRKSGRKLWSAPVLGPDNSSWSSDGFLLIAGHQQDLTHVLACNEHIHMACPLLYKITALRPSDGAAAEVFAGGGPGSRMGGVTIAVEHEHNLYMGSFAGDRMARIKRPTFGAFAAPAP